MWGGSQSEQNILHRQQGTQTHKERQIWERITGLMCHLQADWQTDWLAWFQLLHTNNPPDWLTGLISHYLINSGIFQTVLHVNVFLERIKSIFNGLLLKSHCSLLWNQLIVSHQLRMNRYNIFLMLVINVSWILNYFWFITQTPPVCHVFGATFLNSS